MEEFHHYWLKSVPRALALLTAMSGATAFGTTSPFKTLRVQSEDGLSISVQEYGSPGGKPIVFIHGLLQSHLSWVKQTTGDLSKRFRLITYDLRGHGESDAPTDPRFYRRGASFARDLDRVIRATHASHPVLVGWSLGGTVIGDYLRQFGSTNLSGLVFLDSFIRLPDVHHRAGHEIIEKMSSGSLEERIRARTAFLHACYAKQPSEVDFETQLAFNMLTPPSALKAMIDRSFNYDGVARKTGVPVLVYQGEKDVLVPTSAAQHIVNTFPIASQVVKPGLGHASFFEDPSAFDGALEKFVDGLTRIRKICNQKYIFIRTIKQ